ncbi:nucleoside monophosphate kinase [Paludisphaera sp.]|uniref:adenylate kinase family protein n=1 Tax=Paludisphaera sp. TaxID=2017432 RepID=UPI00301DF9C8
MTADGTSQEAAPPRGKYRTILLFGMPGSGKGTQGAVLGKIPEFVHISMGDVFRKIPRMGRIGAEIESFTSVGRMVPDELTYRIFERHLKILELQEFFVPDFNTLILDGLPRSYAQAEGLSPLLDVVQIFHLQIRDEKLAMKRLRSRALLENRLDDMKEDVIRRRMATYHDETVKTLSFYDPSLVYNVDAGQQMIDVLKDIVNRLSELKRGAAPLIPTPEPAADAVS